MANEIKLEIYTFRIREKKEEEKFEILNSFFKTGFSKFIQAFLNAYGKNSVIDDKLKRSFKISKVKPVIDIAKRMASGVIESGDFGIQSQIQTQAGKLKATKNKNDLDIKPFYFLIKVPSKGDCGIIMLQRTGMFGVSQIFQEVFVSFFEEANPDYRIFTKQFMSKEVAVDLVTKGFIKEIKLSRYTTSSDASHLLKESDASESVEEIEVRLISKRGKSFPLNMNDTAARFMKNSSTEFFDLTPFSSLGYTKDNTTITVKVKEGKKTHTIDLSDTGEVKPYYYIDDMVEKNEKTQLPLFHSIDKIAKEILSDLNFDL